MIDFTIKRCNSVIGGLNFQLVYKFDDAKEIYLTKIDYSSLLFAQNLPFP